MAKGFYIIVAMTEKRGIGMNGTIPWKIPRDMKFFQSITTRTDDPAKMNAVIMGRKTWESIPAKFRPLKGRLNIVLRRHETTLSEPNPSPHIIANNFNLAVEAVEKRDDIESIFVIGGAAIYEAALDHPALQKIYLTRVLTDVSCDTFFPDSDLLSSGPQDGTIYDEGGFRFQFEVLEP